MATVANKSAGRPKAKPSELCLRRIGKHFEAAAQLLNIHQKTPSELRTKGQGKQPFNSYIKSLQEKLAMYGSYLELLGIYAEDAGYDIDTTVALTDEDKERPWKKLKSHFRDNEGKKLALADELRERRKVFDGSRADYNSSYPFIEWCSFWFESEVNAAQRLASQAIMSFDLMGVNYLTIDDCLATAEAKKGRDTFVNKQGKNVRDNFTTLHASIVRHKTRLRKAAEEVGLDGDNLVLSAILIVKGNKDKIIAKKARQVEKLFLKVRSMESSLENALSESSEEDRLNFEIALAKKERLPLVKLQNSNKITPLQLVQLAKVEKVIEALKERLKDCKQKQKQQAA